MKSEKLKVLMELRPCFEGFAGIPQETRLVFHSLSTLNNIELTGLINHHSRRLAPGLRPGIFRGRRHPSEVIRRLSRVIISVKADPIQTDFGKFLRYLERRYEVRLMLLQTFFGMENQVTEFDATNFGDFVWQSLFSKTLPSRDFEMIRNARYASIRPSWDVLNRIAVLHLVSAASWWPLPTVNTAKYDIFMSQTPWPSLLSPRTQLLIRYHDAIPVFLPHTISNAPRHQAAHLAGLSQCRLRGIFACTSEATRSGLVKIYPEIEGRSLVIPDMVSHEYFEETSNPQYVAVTIRSHIHPATEPKFLTVREKERFYERYLPGKPHRFLLIVSTIEPRKNHSKLIAAWDYLKNHGMPDLKLVIIGELGWETTRITASMASAQEKGQLFHLRGVPSSQLRILYRVAAAVVCPSVSEGFDLSGIEAMLCRGAVVASDIPVHREVYADAAEYFNPYSTLDLAKAVERVVGPEAAARREELLAAGLRHAPKYKSANIEPMWHELFDRIRMGEFKRRKGFNKSTSTFPLPASNS